VVRLDPLLAAELERGGRAPAVEGQRDSLTNGWFHHPEEGDGESMHQLGRPRHHLCFIVLIDSSTIIAAAAGADREAGDDRHALAPLTVTQEPPPQTHYCILYALVNKGQ